MANGLDAYIAQLRKEQAMQNAMGVRMPAAEASSIPVAPEPKMVSETTVTEPFVPKGMKQEAMTELEKARAERLAAEAAFRNRYTQTEKEFLTPPSMPIGLPGGKLLAGEVSLPRTYEALQAGEKRLEELQSKMAPPKEAPNLLAEALIAGIPTILGAGIGAAVGKPGMLGAGLAAGAGAGEKALAGVKASEKEQRAAQIKAAEEKMQRQIGLEKAYLEAVGKAETYPMEAALITAKAVAPEFAKPYLMQQQLRSQQLEKTPELLALQAAQKREEQAQQAAAGLRKTGERKVQKKPLQGEEAFKSLPMEDQIQIKNLADASAKYQATSVKFDQLLKQLKDPNISKDQKIKAGQMSLKLLNSQEGQDAVGVDEARRVGSFLETQIANLSQPGPMFGRSLDEFTRQVEYAKGRVDGSVAGMSDRIKSIYGRRAVPIPAPAPTAPTPGARPDFSKMSEAELKKYLGK